MEFFTADTQLPPYIPYARFLLELPLNETARLVYSLLLSRIHLSQSNRWTDTQGNIYCRYTVRELMAHTGKSKSSILAALGNLEAQDLLYRRQGGICNANELYLKLPAAPGPEVPDKTPRRCGNPYPGSTVSSTPEVRKSAPRRYGKQYPNNRNNHDIINKTDYEYMGDSL